MINRTNPKTGVTYYGREIVTPDDLAATVTAVVPGIDPMAWYWTPTSRGRIAVMFREESAAKLFCA